MDLYEIEEQAAQDFVDNIDIRDISDDEIVDYLNVRVDVDRYHRKLFRCTIEDTTILGWIQDDFSSIVDSYLHHKKVREISQLATSTDLDTEDSYYAFCLDTYQAALDFWFDNGYHDEAWEYFREFGEEV